MNEDAKMHIQHLPGLNRYPILMSWFRSLRARNRAPRTIDHYIDTAARFLAYTGGEWDVSHRDIESWVTGMLARGSEHSAHSRFRALQQFYKWLVLEEEIDENPMARLEPPALSEAPKDVLPLETIATVLDHLKKQKRWRDAAIIAIFVDSGLRASELTNLLVDDVDMLAGTALIRDTKTRTPRSVAFSPKTVEYIDRYLRQRSKGKDPEKDKDKLPPWLIAGERGQLTRSGMYQIVRRCFREIGVEGIGCHDLRHTSASHVVAHMTELEMQTVYGWTSNKMIKHYSKQMLGEASIAAQKRASPIERLPRKGRG